MILTDAWGDQFVYPDVAHENAKPEESKLLGPDGKPLKYQHPPVGFDLRRQAK